MMAAAGAAETFSRFPESPERKVTVLEKMPRPGRKIMITGKGKCNITNTRPWNDFSGHIHPKSAPLKAAFYSFSTADTVRFFNDNGLGTVVERGERIFPASHMAKDVVDTLVRAVYAAGATIKTGCCVSSVSAGSDSRGAMFLIRCGNGMEFTCRKLIIATGGLSYPGTGSTGDGYGWARGFGHTIKKCFPSLTALVPEGYKNLSPDGRQPSGNTSRGHIDRSVPLSETGAMLEGNQLKNVSLTLFIDGNPVQEEFGDLDFTDGGLEGAVGFKISRKCVKALINGSKAAISIDLKPAVDKVLAALGVGPEALFSTLGRTAARGVETLVIAQQVEKWLAEYEANIAGGDKKIAMECSVPREGRGVGFVNAPRGGLSHWLRIEDGKIGNFQLVVPTTWNLGPRDAKHVLSAAEQALVGTPVADPKRPVEILRTIHSFDPCIACAVHVIDGETNQVHEFKVL